MDNNYPITDRIERVATHLRLIADLLQGGVDMEDVDRANVAFVMQHLATQLEEVLRGKESSILGINGMDRERQP